MNIENQEQSPEKRFSLKIERSTLWIYLSLILFKLVLDMGYVLLCRDWGYLGYVLDFNALKLIESYLLLFIILVFLPKSPQKLSHVMVWLLVLLSYIPMLTVFAFKDEARIFMYAVTGFWLLVFILMRTPSIRIPSLKQSGVIRYGLFICLAAAVILLVWKYLGLSFKFSLEGVYDIRAERLAAQIPVSGYLFSGLALVANPLFFALFIKKKKWLLVALIVVLQIILFAATGNRSYYLALPFVLVLMWIMRRQNPLVYMGLGLAGVVLLGMLTYWLADNLFISSFFTRRALLTQAQLSFCYYDFFSQNELVFLSASKLGGFSSYPYLLGPANLIGDIYFDNPALNANTGLAGDAFMNFGFIGLVLWTIPLTIILKLVDSFSSGKDYMVAVAAIAVSAISLTNTALLTNILSHGLLLALVFLYLLPRNKSLAKGQL
jgi:hypothetical protein